ncbi:hypothetical protein [Nocardia salmonicida]|uniref:hypothetical protein n=3 Tax=Nocardia salmonicida TaxID=53431 RepID=UPI00371B24FA
MRRSVVAGMLVATMTAGGVGVAGAVPAGDPVAGSSDTGSAVIDAVQLGGVLGLFMAHLLSCNLLGSSASPCTPIGPISDDAPGSFDLDAATGSANVGSATVLSFLLCGIGSDLGSGYCP